MTDEMYITREAKDTDISELLLLIENSYYPYEPTISAYFNSKDISDEERRITINYLVKNKLDSSPIFIIVHRSTKKIFGLIMLKIHENPKLFPNSEASDPSDALMNSPTIPKLAKEYLGCFIFPAAKRFKVFEEFKSVKKAMALKTLCIDSEHRCKGLASILMQEAIKYAKVNKIDVVYGLFTSPLSQKIAMKCGFRSYVDMDILSFKNLEGKPMFEGQDSCIISVMATEF